MMCSTLSISTANWIAERAFRSECTTMLATLRCTNTSPGSSPVIWLAGTRLSEQPIHMNLGFCCLVRLVKNPGRSRSISAAQARLWVNRSWSEDISAIFACAAYVSLRTGVLTYIVSANSSRPISMRRISLVPAPISYSLASRHRRPSG